MLFLNGLVPLHPSFATVSGTLTLFLSQSRRFAILDSAFSSGTHGCFTEVDGNCQIYSILEDFFKNVYKVLVNI